MILIFLPCGMPSALTKKLELCLSLDADGGNVRPAAHHALACARQRTPGCGRQYPPELRGVTMPQTHATQTQVGDHGGRAVEPPGKLKFGKDNGFQVELRRRVDEFFRTSGPAATRLPADVREDGHLLSPASRRPTCCWCSWPRRGGRPCRWPSCSGWPRRAIGFNIQHDGGHQAYSDRPWVNKLMAMTLDLIGGSSYLWHWKHGVFHHTYVNITGHDTDIDLGILGRLTPHQKRLLVPPLAALLPLAALRPDGDQVAARSTISGRHRRPDRRAPLPAAQRAGIWSIFLAGKASSSPWRSGFRCCSTRSGSCSVYYGVAALVLGMVLSVVFQVAHCVEEAEFPLPRQDTGRIENAWAVHQAETTVDFARRSRVVSWLLGGLNFQIEHHLFPRDLPRQLPGHLEAGGGDLPRVRRAVRRARSFRAGLASHFRWLRRMGMPTRPKESLEPEGESPPSLAERLPVQR